MSALRTYVKSLPSDAIACDGPLMFDMNRYIAPDGSLFRKNPTTKNIIQLQPDKTNGQYSWASAKRILEDGSIVDMESIDGFYERSNGKVTPHALVAYYFVRKIIPVGMRATLIDSTEPLHANNLQWGTTQNQIDIRMGGNREKNINKTQPHNYIEEDDVDLREYSEWESTGYYIKNDGTDVVKITSTDRYKRISIRTSSDGYHNTTVHLNGKPRGLRMNRLVAAIHHGLNLDNRSDIVDHIDGNILNNHPDNLQIVTVKENTRRGASARSILKVDPNTMTIVEEIRCIKEFVELNPEHTLKTLRRVKSSAERYKGFIWLDKSLEESLFTQDNGTITIITVDQILDPIRLTIHQLYSEDRITEAMVPLAEDGYVVHTDEICNLINTVDPRGLGDEEILEEFQHRIQGHIPCSRLVSCHGTTANTQIVICLKTLLLYTRSRDNLNLVDRTCPLCVCNRSGNRQKYMPDDPEANIPIHSYTAAAGERAQGDPLAHRGSYLTVANGIGPDYSPSKLKSIRQSLFGLTNKMSNLWASQTRTGRARNHPKRVLSQNLYWSFYQPVDGYMSETNPDWLLARRLNCATMLHLRDAVLARRV